MERKAKFIVYRDFAGGYRWKLCSGDGATIAASGGGHPEKGTCQQAMERWALEYPDATVRDASSRVR